MKAIIKKGKSRILLFVTIFIVLTPILFLVVNTIRGEGITFTSLSAVNGTKKAFKCIKDRDYKGATNYLGFWGYSEDRSTIDPKNIENEKMRFIEGLSNFFNDRERELVNYSDISFATDDGYTKGTVYLEIKQELQPYFFTIEISKQDGKLCPVDITEITTQVEYRDVADNLAKDFIDIIKTHNPG